MSDILTLSCSDHVWGTAEDDTLFEKRKLGRRTEDFNRFQQIMDSLPEDNCYDIDWKEGEVVIYKNKQLLKTITDFQPIYLKSYKKYGHHTGMYNWEGYLSRFFDTENDITYLSFQKWRLQAYTKELHISPKKLLKVLQACMLKAFIPEDLREVANKYCRQQGRKRNWIVQSVENLFARRDIIRQCIIDNQENIIPFIIYAEEGQHTPSLFRKTIGKSAWKQVLKNSPSRNSLICHYMYRTKNSFDESRELPSSLLKFRQTYDMDMANILRQEKLLTKFDSHHNVVNTIKDTKRMYSQLGKDLPKQYTKWSFLQWLSKHEQCVELINARKYSKDIFSWCRGIDKGFISDGEVYNAHLLDNAFDIHTEGKIMHHCVGSYTDRCKNKSYVVFSIKNSNGERVSTLGCHISNGKVVFNQHYGHCNSTVKNEDVLLFAKDIIIEANKRYKQIFKEGKE